MDFGQWFEQMKRYSIYSITSACILIIIISILGYTANTVVVYYHEYTSLLSHQCDIIFIILVVIGVSTILIVILAHCLLIINADCLVKMLSAILAASFLLELVAAVGGFLLRNDIQNFLRDSMNTTIQQYSLNDTKISETWDRLQSTFECCGIDNSTDWIKSNVTNHMLPLSCCPIPPGTSNDFTCTTENNYSNGCLPVFGSHISNILIVIGGVNVGVLIFQLIGFGYAYYKSKRSRNGYQNI